jgi:hypothetical protein
MGKLLILKFFIGNNIIFSSGAEAIGDLRGPRDVECIAVSFGLPKAKAWKCITENPRDVIKHALARRLKYLPTEIISHQNFHSRFGEMSKVISQSSVLEASRCSAFFDSFHTEKESVEQTSEFMSLAAGSDDEDDENDKNYDTGLKAEELQLKPSPPMPIYESKRTRLHESYSGGDEGDDKRSLDGTPSDRLEEYEKLNIASDCKATDDHEDAFWSVSDLQYNDLKALADHSKETKMISECLNVRQHKRKLNIESLGMTL